MRLLHIDTGRLRTFSYPPPVPYAILSHTWSSPVDDEWPQHDLIDTTTHPGTGKSALDDIIRNFCRLARAQQYAYVWAHAACIDKASAAHISETVNALPRYFQGAGVCFVYLADLPCGPSVPCRDSWAQCQFWTRAWTLQELVLPAKIQFYDAHWHSRGERSAHPMPSLISNITGIDEDILARRRSLRETSVARKMSWAASRKAARPEDIAYALLGVFDVCMPIVYGEGRKRAFRRLQEEILKHSNDMSLFAWTTSVDEDHRGIFASSPREFFGSGSSEHARLPFDFDGFAALTSRGVLIEGRFSEHGNHLFLDMGSHAGNEEEAQRHGILLRKSPDGTFERAQTSEIQKLPPGWKTVSMRVMVRRGYFDTTGRCSVREVDVAPEQRGEAHNLPSLKYSLPISIKRPTTPELRSQTSYSSGSDTTPTGLSSTSRADDVEWVNLRGDHCAETEAEADDSDMDICDSMEASQQTLHTELGDDWDSALSVTSGPTTAANSPPQTVDEGFPFVCNWAGQDVEERDAWDTGSQADSMQPLVLDGNLTARLAKHVLARFSASQEIEMHVIEKRMRRLKRSTTGQTSRNRKRRGVSPSETQEFSCPFYTQDPERYVGCLKSHELRNMDDVRDHLGMQHRLPFYCPTCKAQFQLASDRDEHIVQRNCEFQNEFPFDGVSDDQRKLISGTQQTAGERTQWYQVWEILFPDLEHPHSPHLLTGLGSKVSRFRTFWHRHGQALLGECLSEWLPSEVLRNEQEVQDLSSEVLSEAVAALV